MNKTIQTETVYSIFVPQHQGWLSPSANRVIKNHYPGCMIPKLGLERWRELYKGFGQEIEVHEFTVVYNGRIH